MRTTNTWPRIIAHVRLRLIELAFTLMTLMFLAHGCIPE
jgi:hypothetical protein